MSATASRCWPAVLLTAILAACAPAKPEPEAAEELGGIAFPTDPAVFLRENLALLASEDPAVRDHATRLLAGAAAAAGGSDFVLEALDSPQEPKETEAETRRQALRAAIWRRLTTVQGLQPETIFGVRLEPALFADGSAEIVVEGRTSDSEVCRARAPHEALAMVEELMQPHNSMRVERWKAWNEQWKKVELFPRIRVDSVFGRWGFAVNESLRGHWRIDAMMPDGHGHNLGMRYGDLVLDVDGKAAGDSAALWRALLEGHSVRVARRSFPLVCSCLPVSHRHGGRSFRAMSEPPPSFKSADAFLREVRLLGFMPLATAESELHQLISEDPEASAGVASRLQDSSAGAGEARKAMDEHLRDVLARSEGVAASTGTKLPLRGNWGREYLWLVLYADGGWKFELGNAPGPRRVLAEARGREEVPAAVNRAARAEEYAVEELTMAQDGSIRGRDQTGLEFDSPVFAKELHADLLPAWGVSLQCLAEPHARWPIEAIGGWIVQACVVGSPAWEVGLRKWDVIFDIDGRLPARLEDFPGLLSGQRIAAFRLSSETIEIPLRPR